MPRGKEEQAEQIIPKLREVEVEVGRGKTVVEAIDAWIGNSAGLRRKHYHSVRAEDWAAVTGVAGQAAQIPAPSGAVNAS